MPNPASRCGAMRMCTEQRRSVAVWRIGGPGLDGKVFMATADAGLCGIGPEDREVSVERFPCGARLRKGRDDKSISCFRPITTSRSHGGEWRCANMAPLVYKGKVIVGITGAGYGLHLESKKGKQQLGAVVGMAGDIRPPWFSCGISRSRPERIVALAYGTRRRLGRRVARSDARRCVVAS